jgi:hypothetical protein
MEDHPTGLKTAILDKCKSLIDQIMEAEEESLSIPKNLVNFFMYAFMMTQQEERSDTLMCCR